MPIPELNHNHVLPPYLKTPIDKKSISPYCCSMEEFYQRFGQTEERKRLIIGLLELRLKLYDFGIVNGFQWVSGSFVEDVEFKRGRPPGDTDVVTFFHTFNNLDPNDQAAMAELSNLNDCDFTKETYNVDHYFVQHASQAYDPPEGLVAATHYWSQLFSHQRGSQLWKGMVKIDFQSKNEEEDLFGRLR